MSFLSEMREKIETYYRQAGPLGFSHQEMDTEKYRIWMDCLERQSIRFLGSDRAVHYDSFRDIDFTGPEIPHQEWRAQLNRFFWLGPLADAYVRTGEEKWARLARDSMEAWMDFRRYDGTETAEQVWKQFGDNSLSTSIRLGQGKYAGWWGTVPYFEGSPYFDDAFVTRLRRSTEEQLRYLRSNVTRNGNFRISQMDTFLFLGSVLPEGEQYLGYAVDGINAVFRMQVGADGSHCEHTEARAVEMMRLAAVLERMRAGVEDGVQVVVRGHGLRRYRHGIAGCKWVY